ncbi:MAG: N-acetylneuraminate synthase [Phycisphaerae bacterium]|jgi:sialic acid synthase SpsE|nr:MAG: N-acetylneuraminate synthase [Phycisphaerae bacterium]
MKIGHLDTDQRVLVIAEIGVNHDGSIERAFQLVHQARQIGADAVKLQIFNADRLVHPSSRFAAYQQNRTDAVDPREMLKRYELSDQALLRIADEVRSHGLLLIATPFSPEDVPRLVGIGCDAVKIASPDLVNRLLLRHACQTGLPLIVSTGAATWDEITTAVQWLTARPIDFALLHCVSSYPTPLEEAHLVWIEELARLVKVVGYSDHTDHVLTGALAVSSGARIIEKHLTYDRHAAGPDHAASLEPEAFREYIRLIRLAEQVRGRSGRRVLPCEQDVRSVSRQGLVAKRDISSRPIEWDDLTTRRPGQGVTQTLLDRVIGHVPVRPIQTGQWIEADDVA